MSEVRIHPDEIREVGIYCPDCGWATDVRKFGPANPANPKKSWARAYAERAVSAHAAEKDRTVDETHTPMLFTAAGVLRYEPKTGEFAY